jgi:hypothetical protein
MMPDAPANSPAEEVLIIEEQVQPEPSPPARRPGPAAGLIAGLALAGLAVGLAATAIAIRLASSGQRRRGRRRGALLNVQPRMAVFAPNLTISLPFSGMARRMRPRRQPPMPIRAAQFRRLAMARRARSRQQEGGRARPWRGGWRRPAR